MEAQGANGSGGDTYANGSSGGTTPMAAMMAAAAVGVAVTPVPMAAMVMPASMAVAAMLAPMAVTVIAAAAAVAAAPMTAAGGSFFLFHFLLNLVATRYFCTTVL